MSKERAWSVLALVQVGLLAQYSAPTVVAVALVEIVMTEIMVKIKMMVMTKTYDLNMVVLSMMRTVIITTMWTRRWSC